MTDIAQANSKKEFGSDDPVKTIVAGITDHSLPLWSREGWDSSNGGFVEQLDQNGRADYAAARRVRVQARQIYCFAKAARLGWYPEGREIAEKGLEFLLAKARSPDGRPGYVHVLGPDGSVRNPLRDAYDHAFVLLALSTMYQLNGDAQVLAEIKSLLAFLDDDLGSPHGGYIEGIPPSLPRRQNPQMHLFEAMIATFDATGEPVFRDHASRLFELFKAHLYDQQGQILGEYFADDWSRVEPVCVEPGHQAEWVWLLQNFERVTGVSTGRYRSELLASALRFRDPSTGCLVDEGDASGSITKSTRRCWPQTEIVKAWIAQAEAGEDGAVAEALSALARLQRHYLSHPVLGGWYDQFDRDDRSLVNKIPASTFYHILCAAAEAERVLSKPV